MAPSPRVRRIIKWFCAVVSFWILAVWIQCLLFTLNSWQKPNPDGHEHRDMVFAASAGMTLVFSLLVLVTAIPTAWLWYTDRRASA